MGYLCVCVELVHRNHHPMLVYWVESWLITTATPARHHGSQIQGQHQSTLLEEGHCGTTAGQENPWPVVRPWWSRGWFRVSQFCRFPAEPYMSICSSDVCSTYLLRWLFFPQRELRERILSHPWIYLVYPQTNNGCGFLFSPKMLFSIDHGHQASQVRSLMVYPASQSFT